jgi:hypothetical protein
MNLRSRFATESLEPRVLLSAAGATPAADDTVAPTVRQVYVGGTWPSAFVDFLRSQGLAEQDGFSVPGGSHQLDPMPWSTLNSVAIRFSEPVRVDWTDLSLRGANVPSYGVVRFVYDTATCTAGWLLDRTIANDTIQITLAGDATGGAGAVPDLAGNPLDGEWADGLDDDPIGDVSPGGDFRFRFNVLPGDATGDGRVNALDVAEVKQHLGGRVPDPGGTPDGVYSVFSDIDTSGRINALDIASLRRYRNLLLQTPNPAAAS